MSSPSPFHRPVHRIPIVLASTTLLSLAPTWRTMVLTLAEFATAAFFISGPTYASLGGTAPWFVLAIVLAGLVIRTADIEGWALFIPGGLIGRVKQAFGHRAALTAAAAVLIDRLLFVALASVVAAHYAVSFAVTVLGSVQLEGQVTADGLATWLALALVATIWIRLRIAHPVGAGRLARWIWAPFLLLVAVAILGLISLARSAPGLPPLPALPQAPAPSGAWSDLPWLARLPSIAMLIVSCLTGLGYALPALGSGDGLTRAASDLPQPRLRSLRRIALVLGACSLLIIAGSAFVFNGLVPAHANSVWLNAPLMGIVKYLLAPEWLRSILMTLLVAAAAMLLAQAAHVGLSDADATLQRLSKHGVITPGLRVPHPRFGTPASVIDAVAAAVVIVILTSSGRIAWLAHAYAVGVVWTQGFKVASLARLRRRHVESATTAQAAGAAPPSSLLFGSSIAGIGWTLCLVLITIVITLAGVTLLAVGDPPTWAGTGAMVGLAIVLSVSDRRRERIADADEAESFELLSPEELSLDRVEARPGNILVAVRHPYSLSHLTAALQAAGDRDVVVMTARLHGHDAEDETDATGGTNPTGPERFLFSQVMAVAERYDRPVRLLIVPAHDVFDALIAAVLRLRSSEVYVGESGSLSADAQARLLGEAWERAPKSETLNVRLVIRHSSGRTATYFLGAHAPTLTGTDLDLIHHLWLDAVKAVGPHVHHHDVVRAALIQMAQQLDGPNREEALEAIRNVARPADELAAVVRRRDFSQLRDMMRNRPPSDIATLLTELPVEEQVLAFRLLPRRDAAATFEYLSLEAQEALLKAMAQEDVAALLNDMAPDDRTMFLEELPATVTRQLLALLTPEERSVAVSLLGYPENSIGRLMTPHYVAVREDWTVRQVLDYVRTHGQDSETLNVIYVVDDQGLLIDDIRIREFLLTSLDSRVADLMDRRFVALKASDNQDTAVALFRRFDRVALPVTDTAGMLIGIVTIDDVLDVAEAAATKEIQKIGGSEALDEPYMRIAFVRMIQKRAGWLTALFIGEMLTATAMGAFEREIERAVVLALFVPLIISSGGNSGSQASTLVIRALALGEVTLRDWWKVARRELAAGLSLGAILGLIGFARIMLWSAFSPTMYTEHYVLVALTVGFSLIGIVLWGTLIGSLLPFLLRRLGFDPATSSAPFVATLVDVTGLIIYFSVALVILHGTLL